MVEWYSHKILKLVKKDSEDDQLHCVCVKTAWVAPQIPGPLASQNGGQWSKVRQEGQKLGGGLMNLGFISNISMCCVKDPFGILAETLAYLSRTQCFKA